MRVKQWGQRLSRTVKLTIVTSEKVALERIQTIAL
jgi:hypothetical protein